MLKFEWDEDKNRLNLKKHGIDFETAILFVVYTERKENIRIISARLATQTERNIYYDKDSYFG